MTFERLVWNSTTMPCTQPHTATAMNRPIFVALAGTPTMRAASLLPPTAKIQLPTFVRGSTHAAERPS